MPFDELRAGDGILTDREPAGDGKVCVGLRLLLGPTAGSVAATEVAEKGNGVSIPSALLSRGCVTGTNSRSGERQGLNNFSSVVSPKAWVQCFTSSLEAALGF